MSVTAIRPAGPNDIELYKNLFNMYQNELSVFYTHGEMSFVDENGYFDADTVKEIFPPDDSILPYVITSDGKNIGLMLITKKPYAKADYCVEEIFVVNAVRGTGAAKEAVGLFFKAHPGKYTLEVFDENSRASAFWHKTLPEFGTVLAEAPGSPDMTEITFMI